MYIITPANPDDLPELCSLLALLFTQEADFQADCEAQMRGLTTILEQPELGQLLVTRRDGRVLGMVNLLYTISTALGGKVALLEDLVVAPQERGAGIGSQLLQQAIQWARAAGCLRVTLLTDQSNVAAQRFYQRHGFQFSAMVPMRLALGE